jgi:superfamily II DNA or RNA helicase
LHGSPFEVRDYQIDTLIKGSRVNQRLFISPTSSGKSLMIYMFTELFKNKKILIIVPTTTLVHQMESDFKEYGSKENYHKIFSGQEKEPLERITVSTWQSLYNLPKKWFHSFDMVIGDEAHLYKAASLKYIMENLVNAYIRFGFTGTLDGLQVNEMVLRGLFGPLYKVVSIKTLTENKQISKFNIKSVLLKYTNEERQKNNSIGYQDEIDFLVSNQRRNEFIKNLCLKIKGNTILFFQYVEKHGKPLYEMIKKDIGDDRKIFFISGEVDGEERNDIRKIVEKEKDCIIVASYGTTSTGINIRKIENLIFASPSKSRVKVLQSIGRGLRLSKDKEMVTIYDIADDLSWKTKNTIKVNHTFRHFTERMKIYNEEEFEYKMHTINI